MSKKRRSKQVSSETKKEKILNQRNVIIGIIVGATVILSFLIELPQKISESISVFNTPTVVTTPKAFPTADSQTPLIIVANFQNRSSDQNSLDPAQYIYERLKSQIQKDSLKVDVRRLYEDVNENTVLSTGQAYNATLVLWGWYDVFTINPRIEFIKKDKTISLQNELKWRLSDPEKIEFIVVTDLPNQSTYLSLLTLGVERFWSGQYDTAFQYLDNAIKNIPSNSLISTNPTELYFYRGAIYLNKQNFQNAIDDFTTAIKLKPDFFAVYNSRGVAYTFTEQYKEALSDFDFAIQLNPNIAQPYNNRGLIYDYQGDYDRAILDYEKALQITPNYEDAYYNLGFAYLNKLEIDKAIPYFNKVIEMNPTYAPAYHYRGLAFMGKLNFDLALDDLNKAIELNPNYAEAYETRGLLYKTLGNRELAIKDFEKILEISDDMSLRKNAETYLQELKP